MTGIGFHYKLINLQECLMRFAYSLTADTDDAKDLFQETILKSLKSTWMRTKENEKLFLIRRNNEANESIQ
jgi:DNA-directed RNA polymerase specialized sigma24 family protein